MTSRDNFLKSAAILVERDRVKQVRKSVSMRTAIETLVGLRRVQLVPVMENSESARSLTDKYKIESEDDDSKNWARLLDFESPIKTESDWYSTQTFQVFLDSLDINQPSRSSNEFKKSILDGQTSDKIGDKTNCNGNNDKQSKKTETKQERDKSPLEAKHDKREIKKQQGNFETILSAEALKILSDLPDLSHMSATRSFIYPATIPATGMGQKTRVNSSKR